jgi:hypothetical protein
VRVTGRNRMCRYQPGDKGTIVHEVVSAPSNTRYYLVAMDKDNHTHTGVVFNADEIEADVCPEGGAQAEAVHPCART